MFYLFQSSEQSYLTGLISYPIQKSHRKSYLWPPLCHFQTFSSKLAPKRNYDAKTVLRLFCLQTSQCNGLTTDTAFNIVKIRKYISQRAKQHSTGPYIPLRSVKNILWTTFSVASLTHDRHRVCKNTVGAVLVQTLLHLEWSLFMRANIGGFAHAVKYNTPEE